MATIPRLFLKESLAVNKEIRIVDKKFHYIVNVMRCKDRDKIILINGKDGEFISEISSINKKYIILLVINKTKDYIKQRFLGLIFSPIQKIEPLLKMSVELGVTDFYPVITEYTNKNYLSQNKVEGNIIEALEQSERLDYPNYNNTDKLENLLKNLSKTNSLIFFCEERTANNSPIDIYKTIPINNKNIYALVGPEGGFSKNEKELIKSFANVQPISLGNNILRTETATASILSIIKSFYFNIC